MGTLKHPRPSHATLAAKHGFHGLFDLLRTSAGLVEPPEMLGRWLFSTPRWCLHEVREVPDKLLSAWHQCAHGPLERTDWLFVSACLNGAEDLIDGIAVALGAPAA